MIGVVLLAVVGGATYFFMSNNDKAEKKEPVTNRVSTPQSTQKTVKKKVDKVNVTVVEVPSPERPAQKKSNKNTGMKIKPGKKDLQNNITGKDKTNPKLSKKTPSDEPSKDLIYKDLSGEKKSDN